LIRLAGPRAGHLSACANDGWAVTRIAPDWSLESIVLDPSGSSVMYEGHNSGPSMAGAEPSEPTSIVHRSAGGNQSPGVTRFSRRAASSSPADDRPIATDDHPLRFCKQTTLALATAPGGQQGSATGSPAHHAVFPVEVGEDALAGILGSWLGSATI
jgi:hypothetical protein